MSITIAASTLAGFVRDIFVAAGCSSDEGERIGKYLVEANLTGHDSHGVIRVPRYVQMLRDGAIVPDVTVDVVIDTPVLAVVDGKYGFGQTVAPQAVRIGIDKCKHMGLSAVALRNAGHTGRTGDFAEMAEVASAVPPLDGEALTHFERARGFLRAPQPFDAEAALALVTEMTEIPVASASKGVELA